MNYDSKVVDAHYAQSAVNIMQLLHTGSCYVNFQNKKPEALVAIKISRVLHTVTEQTSDRGNRKNKKHFHHR
jgi:hypothetical protein